VRGGRRMTSMNMPRATTALGDLHRATPRLGPCAKRHGAASGRARGCSGAACTGRAILRPRQQPFLPRAILTNAVWAREHYAVSDREVGVAGILDDTRALVAEHQRRLGPRVSTRQELIKRPWCPGHA
jgi:hypothetical protein